MKIGILAICLTLATTFAAAETKTFKGESTSSGTKTDACKSAKDDAQTWVAHQTRTSTTFITGKGSGGESYSQCDCSARATPIGTAWVCTVDATVGEAKSTPGKGGGEVSEMRPFDDTYADRTTACRGARGQAEDYVNRIPGAVLKGITECRCETKIASTNVAGPWVTCFVNANITRPK